MPCSHHQSRFDSISMLSYSPHKDAYWCQWKEHSSRSKRSRHSHHQLYKPLLPECLSWNRAIRLQTRLLVPGAMCCGGSKVCSLTSTNHSPCESEVSWRVRAWVVWLWTALCTARTDSFHLVVLGCWSSCFCLALALSAEDLSSDMVSGEAVAKNGAGGYNGL